MATASLSVRERMAAAVQADRAASSASTAAPTGVITLRRRLQSSSSVLFIFVFIFAEAVPLFRAATAERLGDARRWPPAGTAAARACRGVRRRRVPDATSTTSNPTPASSFFAARTDGQRTARVPVPGLEPAAPSIALVLAQPRWATTSRPGPPTAAWPSCRCASRPSTRTRCSQDLDVDAARPRASSTVDPAERPVREVSYHEQDGREVRRRARRRRRDRDRPRGGTDDEGAEHRAAASSRGRAGRAGHPRPPRAQRRRSWRRPTAASSTTGSSTKTTPRLTDVSHGRATNPSPRSSSCIGGNSVIVGTTSGQVSRAGSGAAARRGRAEAMVKAHEFEPQGSAVRRVRAPRPASAASPRRAPTARSCCAT